MRKGRVPIPKLPTETSDAHIADARTQGKTALEFGLQVAQLG